MRAASGGRVEYTGSTAKCRYQAELSLETLVWTRGRNMPLAGLGDRMMCHPASNPASLKEYAATDKGIRKVSP